jgi:cytochrome P450
MTGTLTDPDALVFEVLATPEGRRDPYPRYRALRESAPIHRSALGHLWYLTRYEDTRFVLRDPRFGKHPDGAMPGFGVEDADRSAYMANFRRASMLFLDPPDHTRLRGLVSREFTPRRVDALRPRIRELLGPMLDRMADERDTDVMQVLAFSLPVAVIGELVGVPERDRESFRTLVRATAALIEPAIAPDALERAAAAQDTMRDYFRGLIADRRRKPADDLLSALIEAEEHGDRLTEDEVVANTILLFAAGFETTTNLIGNGLLTLLRNPDQLAALRDQNADFVSAVEEILRFESPVQLDARYVQVPVDLDGHRIAAGDTVITFLGAANRDPSRFEEPDRFEIGRPDNQPLSFGFGIHHCLGAQLARAEGQEVFQTLMRRFRTIELIDDGPAWRPGITLRGLEHLHVRVTL